MTMTVDTSLSSRDLEGAVALITGAASGLGAATACTLGAAGASVVVADVNAAGASAVAEQMCTSGLDACALALDIADEHAVDAALRRVIEARGAIHVLVNNAGIDLTAPVDEISVRDWDRICAVNLRAPFVLSRAVFPHMRERGSGSIVNIVSTAAKRAWANASVYHATKWGLLGLSHALHVEGREHGIRVTAIIAGGMRTPFLLDRFPDLDPALLQEPDSVAQAVRWVLTQPAGTVVPEVTVLPMRETSWP